MLFYDAHGKTFPYYVEYHHALAGHYCMQLAPLRLLPVLLAAAGVWLLEGGTGKEGFALLGSAGSVAGVQWVGRCSLRLCVRRGNSVNSFVRFALRISLFIFISF